VFDARGAYALSAIWWSDWLARDVNVHLSSHGHSESREPIGCQATFINETVCRSLPQFTVWNIDLLDPKTKFPFVFSSVSKDGPMPMASIAYRSL
jgi:hypothetical protein